jgi:hypothetical protein
MQLHGQLKRDTHTQHTQTDRHPEKGKEGHTYTRAREGQGESETNTETQVFTGVVHQMGVQGDRRWKQDTEGEGRRKGAENEVYSFWIFTTEDMIDRQERHK